MTGIYSNGQLIPLFRVGLAKFLNNFGLSNEGGNLFRETRASGSAITNKPGENGLGTIAPNSLEMSNVDISEEFVTMITTQRGFQANWKQTRLFLSFATPSFFVWYFCCRQSVSC